MRAHEWVLCVASLCGKQEKSLINFAYYSVERGCGKATKDFFGGWGREGMKDLNVDQIKKLWILDLIIQTGSLKQASLKAKVTPSAISQSLSGLEQSLGRPLIIRERGIVRATPEAEALLQKVRPAFEIFDQLRDLHQSPLPKMTWLNFGTYESIALEILPGLLKSLRLKMPQLRLSLRISRTASLLSMVRKGELCSALIAEVDDLDRFFVKDVAKDRLGLYVAKHSPFVAKGEFEAIEKLGIGSLAPGKEGLPRYFGRFLKQFNNFKPILLSDSFEIIRGATATGAIVGVLPHRVAMRSDDLMELKEDGVKKRKETGQHRICVVSQANCDPEETNFIAREASQLLRMH